MAGCGCGCGERTLVPCCLIPGRAINTCDCGATSKSSHTAHPQAPRCHWIDGVLPQTKVSHSRTRVKLPGSRPVGCPDRPRYTPGLSACTCAREPTHPPWSLAYAFPSHLLRGADCPPPHPPYYPRVKQSEQAFCKQGQGQGQGLGRTCSRTHAPLTLPFHHPQALSALCFLASLSCSSSVLMKSRRIP